VHLRGKAVDYKREKGSIKDKLHPEHLGMQAAAKVFASAKNYERAQTLARVGQGVFAKDGYIESLPGYLSGWTKVRDIKAVPKESFRDWWRKREKKKEASDE